MPLGPFIKIDRGFPQTEVVTTERGKNGHPVQHFPSPEEMSIKVIAEGVETEEQAPAFLLQAGCDLCAGLFFFYSRPPAHSRSF